MDAIVCRILSATNAMNFRRANRILLAMCTMWAQATDPSAFVTGRVATGADDTLARAWYCIREWHGCAGISEGVVNSVRRCGQ